MPTACRCRGRVGVRLPPPPFDSARPLRNGPRSWQATRLAARVECPERAKRVEGLTRAGTRHSQVLDPCAAAAPRSPDFFLAPAPRPPTRARLAVHGALTGSTR